MVTHEEPSGASTVAASGAQVAALESNSAPTSTNMAITSANVRQNLRGAAAALVVAGYAGAEGPTTLKNTGTPRWAAASTRSV